jgi:putative membrane protein
MKNLFFRFTAYFALLILFSLIFKKVSGGPGIMAVCAFVLAIVNTLVRPLFTIIALPANIITLGIASVFVNMLTVTISDALVGGASIEGVWVNLVIAITVMLCDSALRKTGMYRIGGRAYVL